MAFHRRQQSAISSSGLNGAAGIPFSFVSLGYGCNDPTYRSASRTSETPTNTYDHPAGAKKLAADGYCAAMALPLAQGDPSTWVAGHPVVFALSARGFSVFISGPSFGWLL